MVQAIYGYFEDPHEFEKCAASLWAMEAAAVDVADGGFHLGRAPKAAIRLFEVADRKIGKKGRNR